MKFRRSQYFVKDLTAGDVIKADAVRSVRPGVGIAPKHLEAIIGKRVQANIRRNSPVNHEILVLCRPHRTGALTHAETRRRRTARPFNGTELDCAEPKETFRGDVPKKGRQAVCAFTYDLPGHDKPGVFFIRAKDDGEPSQLDITDQLLLSLSDRRLTATYCRFQCCPSKSVPSRVRRSNLFGHLDRWMIHPERRS